MKAIHMAFFLLPCDKKLPQNISVVSKAKRLIPNYKFMMTNKRVFFRDPLEQGHRFLHMFFSSRPLKMGKTSLS
jgi:hypothetical protein